MTKSPTWAQQWVLRQLRFDHTVADRARELPKTPEQWRLVVDAARGYGFRSLLLSRLPANDSPDNVRSELEQARREIFHTNLLLQFAVQEWLERFQASGIPAIVLKGAALVRQAYGRLDLRPMRDIDFLIRREDYERAMHLLAGSGLRRANDSAANDTDLRTQTMFYASGLGPICVDLHWHLLDSAYYVRRVPIGWFWDHTLVLRDEQPEMRVFSSESQLLHLAAHLELHHAGTSPFLIYDIARLLDRFADSMDWDLVTEAAARFEWGQSLRSAVQRAQSVFGVSLPESINASLSHLRSTGHERLTRALAVPEAHPAAFIFDGWEQGNWSQRLRYWRQCVLPSNAFMQERHAEFRRRSRRDCIRRWGRGLVRIPRALAAGAMVFIQLGNVRT